MSAAGGPAGAPSRLTVLYDAECALCRKFQQWLAAEPTFVALDFVPCGSAEARARFPGLDHERTRNEITLVGDDGGVWTHDAAWIMAMWATRRHRPMAERLSRPAWRPMARAAAYAAAGIRESIRQPSVGGGSIDSCGESCGPIGQG
jgi:predicted DCC family thiol-disulfide oxidoreductase YuxK